MEEKQLYGHFKPRASNFSLEKTWTRLRKRNLKRKTKSLLIAAKNNTIRTNHSKTRIDKTLQISRCSLCGDREETINRIIREYSKFAQEEYKTRHDFDGHLELCKKLKFDHANKWYMHNSESVLEKETYKLLWDFDIQTDRLISAKRPDLVIINNKKRRKKKEKR